MQGALKVMEGVRKDDFFEESSKASFQGLLDKY